MNELIELEKAGWTSLCDGTGADFYGATMTPDGLMILADGSVMTRDDVVGALAQAPPWVDFEMDDVRVVPIAENSAALVYVGRAHRDGNDSFVAVMTSVYVRSGGPWRLAIYQQTRQP
jgi:hypothetical protein